MILFVSRPGDKKSRRTPFPTFISFDTGYVRFARTCQGLDCVGARSNEFICIKVKLIRRITIYFIQT